MGPRWAGEPQGPPPDLHVTLCVACHLQVDGKKYPSFEDGIQVVVIDGKHGQVLNHTGFRNAILQGIPWQLFNYMVTVPDK